jgi:two-component sensor histidine kinase
MYLTNRLAQTQIQSSLQQENFKRIAAELRQANDIFEARVQQRTAELAEANESLSAEIEERRRAEAVLKESEAKLRVSVGTTEAALKEKEILLRELHHRVKNNLQVITSLLSLQCGKLHDQTSRELFKECQQRIYAIALVHEKLYRAPSLGDLDLASYFRDLVQNLLRCYCVKSADVKPRIIVEEASVGIDHLIPCGLIVNELVCNALKYAFPQGRSGEVCVELRRIGGYVSLRVADDGVGGLPSGVLSVNGVGQQIVKALVDQLSGKLEWANGRGTSATVTFPEMK